MKELSEIVNSDVTTRTGQGDLFFSFIHYKTATKDSAQVNLDLQYIEH